MFESNPILRLETRRAAREHCCTVPQTKRLHCESTPATQCRLAQVQVQRAWAGESWETESACSWAGLFRMVHAWVGMDAC